MIVVSSVLSRLVTANGRSDEMGGAWTWNSESLLDFILQQLLLENSHMHFTEMSLSTVLFACLRNFRLLLGRTIQNFTYGIKNMLNSQDTV